MITARNFGLDLARAIAITLVIADHSKFFFTPIYPILNTLKVCSFMGVELFFVLSGFLIGSSLLKSFLSEKPFGIPQIINFWKRRWWRTLPNYFLILILLLIFYPPENIAFLDYFFFIQNFNAAMPAFYSVSWSLTIEEWFYLSLPLLLAVSGIFSKRRAVKLLLVSISILIYLFTFIFIRHLSIHDVDAWNTEIRQVLIYRIDAVGYGVLIAFINMNYSKVLEEYRNILLICGGVMILAGGYIFFHLQSEDMPLWVSSNLIFISVSAGFSLMIPFLKYLKPPASNQVIWLVTKISVTSYAMYLVNYDLVLRAFSGIFVSSNLLNSIAFWGIYMVASISLSFIIYTYFESPLLVYRDKNIPKI